MGSGASSGITAAVDGASAEDITAALATLSADSRAKLQKALVAARQAELRPLGSQGLRAFGQGYGCMGLTVGYGKALPDADAAAVLQRAFDLGITHFDTAEMYKSDQEDGTTKYNEEVVGKFAAAVGHNKITIATKYFPSPDKQECTKEQVKTSLEASLSRLGMDCVDLYYLHRIPQNEEHFLSWVNAAKELVEEGKCKYVGLSEATAAQIRKAHEIHPITAVQQEWSMLVRNLEADIVPTCRELGIAIVAYSPLCRGFTSALVKKAEDWNKIGNEGGAAGGFQSLCPHLSGDNLEANANLLAPLEEKASELGCTPAQLSLAWVHAQGVDVFPIPGTTKIKNLESNVAAFKLAKDLAADVFKDLGTAVDHTKVMGERYPEMFMPMCYEKKEPAPAA